MVSTHTPLAGRDDENGISDVSKMVSTHTPLAGRDDDSFRTAAGSDGFLLTRPLRDVT